MLASVDHGFVLLSFPKTGTSALEASFNRFSEFKVGGKPKWKHINYRNYQNIFGNFFERRNCDVFVVVRHPVDSLWSWFRYRCRDELKDPNHPFHANYCGNLSFKQFLEAWASANPPRYARLPNTRGFIVDKNGDVPDINIYRYEDISKLHGRICKKIGKNIKLPKRNVSPKHKTIPDQNFVVSFRKMQKELEFYNSLKFCGEN